VAYDVVRHRAEYGAAQPAAASRPEDHHRRGKRSGQLTECRPGASAEHELLGIAQPEVGNGVGEDALPVGDLLLLETCRLGRADDAARHARSDDVHRVHEVDHGRHGHAVRGGDHAHRA
jgi:hypothetical protein